MDLRNGVIVVCLMALFALNHAKPLPVSPVTHIAFGSCNEHDEDQSIWKSIIAAKPDLFVWLGDVIYGDSESLPMVWSSSSLDKMAEKLMLQKTSPLYSQLRDTTPIVGIWDDHDYGKNNAGAEYKDKVESQRLFLDFMDEPKDSKRRSQEGVYTSYYLPGPHSDHDILLVLLDVRYHQTGSMGYGDLLGDEQWKWLESTLAGSSARINLIGSGIQVLPFQKPIVEAWSSHPHNRQRLFDLFAKLRLPGVVLLSGDVHYSEVFRVPAECSGSGYPIYEFTSSGLTHACDGPYGSCKPNLEKWFNTPFHFGDSFYTALNWGSLHFDWQNERLSYQTHDVNGSVVHEVVLALSDLQPPAKFDSASLGAISRCDGPPNWFLLIPFDSYKLVLYVIPLSLIALALFAIYGIYRVIAFIVRLALSKAIKHQKTD